MNWQVIIDSN